MPPPCMYHITNRVRSGTVWDGMPYRHFPGRVKIITSLPSRELSYRYACTKFGKLILRKIINTVATRRHILKLKCTKFDFGRSSTPDPAGGACSAPPGPPAGFEEVYFWGKGGEEGQEGRAREEGERRVSEGRERKRRGNERRNRQFFPPLRALTTDMNWTNCNTVTHR